MTAERPICQFLWHPRVTAAENLLFIFSYFVLSASSCKSAGCNTQPPAFSRQKSSQGGSRKAKNLITNLLQMPVTGAVCFLCLPAISAYWRQLAAIVGAEDYTE
ncbi:MAG: hypothetical protein KME19_10705 [Microcoleus vaginatus WJT46-NPBG5]|jgi:hypothetical protein|nr:hypothetical protein [Microcoleus vaginatus WJT46-NPBG5]